MDANFPMATARIQWMTATKRAVTRGLWPGSRAATNWHIANSPAAILPAMLGLARRILGNAADAEDVAQEAMLRVWTHAPRWQPLAAFRTWLTRVVVNLCLDRKRRRPWVALEAAGEIVDPTPGVTEKAEHDERERLLAAAIADLPARQRTAIVLTYSEGMSNAQVADILDTSVSAVETLLVRGKQNLRAHLKA